jgi:hypothetical protein
MVAMVWPSAGASAGVARRIAIGSQSDSATTRILLQQQTKSTAGVPAA